MKMLKLLLRASLLFTGFVLALPTVDIFYDDETSLNSKQNVICVTESRHIDDNFCLEKGCKCISAFNHNIKLS